MTKAEWRWAIKHLEQVLDMLTAPEAAKVRELVRRAWDQAITERDRL